ncbi:hypothetical protein K458DRAFT_199296 [Lentithecium fluviatile CBS 122367]|uniref:Uncharacterized protein n=1 Tax=Lentithecium fluviatile CBS 122367 TaxID=1168545 RepID=A0A6G1J8J4_9PLEO|nr:hypothetical protein K458DRAFT_199296 [Lentithecium fluviatile CBS 122367]
MAATLNIALLQISVPAQRLHPQVFSRATSEDEMNRPLQCRAWYPGWPVCYRPITPERGRFTARYRPGLPGPQCKEPWSASMFRTDIRCRQIVDFMPRRPRGRARDRRGPPTCKAYTPHRTAGVTGGEQSS